MNVLELLLELRKLRITLNADGEQLRFAGPKGALTSVLRDEIAKHKPKILEMLRSRKASPAGLPPLKHVPREGQHLPLSYSQEMLWFRHEVSSGSILSNIHMNVRFDGALDVVVFRQALEEVFRRHDILRTTIHSDQGVPGQTVNDLLPALPLTDLSELEVAQRAAATQQLAAEEGSRSFDLARGPLVRTSLIRLEPESHLLILIAHHVISDERTLEILLREWVTLYSSLKQGKASPLPAPVFQYADFVFWQRELMTTDALDRQRTYWKSKLAGPLPVLALPTDRPRLQQSRFKGAHETLVLTSQLSAALKQLAATSAATPFMAVLGAFKALLYRYTGEGDVVVGTPIGGRPLVEMEALMGPFINTLALRTQLSSDLTFSELLGRVRDTAVGAYTHQELPFQQVTNLLNGARNTGHDSLFQVMISMAAPTQEQVTEGLRFIDVPFQNPVADFELTLYFSDDPGGFSFVAEYQTELFDPVTMVRLLDHLKLVIEDVVRRPDIRLRELLPAVVSPPAASAAPVAAADKSTLPARRQALTPEQREALQRRLRGQR